jgi:hypothetical protein
MKVWITYTDGMASEYSMTEEEIDSGLSRGFLKLVRDGEVIYIPREAVKTVSFTMGQPRGYQK